jgi:hypothetical protein
LLGSDRRLAIGPVAERCFVRGVLGLDGVVAVDRGRDGDPERLQEIEGAAALGALLGVTDGEQLVDREAV